MSTDEKLQMLENMLELGASVLKPQTKLEEIKEWDSMATLSLIVLLEENFGKEVSGKEIKEMKTVSDILLVME